MGITTQGRVAYFSMEIGISHTIPTYSGGLGMLAGDLLKSYADMNVPVIGITLLNEKGYFHQKMDSDGNQIEEPVHWNPSDRLIPLQNHIKVQIEGRDVIVGAWKLIINGITGHSIPIYYLDTNIDGNSAYDRTLTSFLYGGDSRYRLAQEIILGIGGVRMLESLGENISKYHMNEGHAALLVVELLRKNYSGADNKEKVKNSCVFTTHTPVAAGHDRFDRDLFLRITGGIVPESIIQESLIDNKFNMTLLGLNYSKYINGVAIRHGEVAREMFPHYQIDAITNGVHPGTWTSKYFKEVFDKHLAGWAHDPYSLRYVCSIPKEELWNAHMQAKKELIEEINTKTGAEFHELRFTIGCARRFTPYKRPDMILGDIKKLKEIAKKVGDIQIVFAGKAHAKDYAGKDLIKHVIRLSREINKEEGPLKIVFLENYDIGLAQKMVAGCDVWLNNPQRPLEASGTSGMKAAMNGVPHLSTLDGWWLEGHIEGVTGWSLGPHPNDPGFNNDPDAIDEALDLYTKLEQTIIPTFYGNHDAWIRIMGYVIAVNASFFNSYRMAQQYITNAYQ
ncbi:MAG: alpha-glucan family phosphorylase [Candidatus Woesearchaeota archaeon]